MTEWCTCLHCDDKHVCCYSWDTCIINNNKRKTEEWSQWLWMKSKEELIYTPVLLASAKAAAGSLVRFYFKGSTRTHKAILFENTFDIHSIWQRPISYCICNKTCTISLVNKETNFQKESLVSFNIYLDLNCSFLLSQGKVMWNQGSQYEKIQSNNVIRDQTSRKVAASVHKRNRFSSIIQRNTLNTIII